MSFDTETEFNNFIGVEIPREYGRLMNFILCQVLEDAVVSSCDEAEVNLLTVTD